MTGDKLVEALIRSRKKNNSNFLFGTVTSISPLVIMVNDLPPLKESMLIVGSNCREKHTYIDKHNHVIPSHVTELASSHTHPINPWETEYVDDFIIINRGLGVGDKVFLIQSNDEQMFYVAERIGGDRD